jgi:hypothetical protein
MAGAQCCDTLLAVIEDRDDPVAVPGRRVLVQSSSLSEKVFKCK